MTESIFAPIIPTTVIENAIIATVALWGPRYLAEVERQSGLQVGSLERPRAVAAAFDLENWAEYQSPSVVVSCPGVLGEPEKHSQGRYSGWFAFKLGAYVVEQDEPSTRVSAQVYQAALETLIAQQGAFGDGGVIETIWTGRDIHLPDITDRTQALAVSDFKVWMQSILSAADGPLAPAETPSTPGTPEPGNEVPYPPWPEVLTTHITVTGEPIAD